MTIENINVKSHTRTSKKGNKFTVKSHTRKINKKKTDFSKFETSIEDIDEIQKFSFSQIINEKTKKKFKEFRLLHKEFPDDDREYGFAISKSGELTGDFEESIEFGKKGEISITSKAVEKFGVDNIAFTIHSHFELIDKGEKTFTNHFSLDDLIKSITFGDVPGLVYREYDSEIREGKLKEYETYYLKVAPNLPKNRMSLINEYGSILKEFDQETNEFKKKWGANKDSFYFLNLNNEDYTKHDKERDFLIEKYVSKIEKFEKKYDFQTKKLFRYRIKSS